MWLPWGGPRPACRPTPPIIIPIIPTASIILAIIPAAALPIPSVATALTAPIILALLTGIPGIAPALAARGNWLRPGHPAPPTL